jgi:FMN phosphatase YigB (HAD superfamily)
VESCSLEQGEQHELAWPLSAHHLGTAKQRHMMFPTRVQYAKNNLLLCFDAFGTLFRPNTPIPSAYAQAAIKHGVKLDVKDPAEAVAKEFKLAFKEASKQSPNYGKAVGLGAEKWWARVSNSAIYLRSLSKHNNALQVINNTFRRWLKPGEDVPQALVDDLLQRYSTKEGYDIYPDVIPFFRKLQSRPSSKAEKSWPWERTIVGIITNSDDRVPGILSSFGLKIGPRRVDTPDQRKAEAALEDDISFVVLSYDVGVSKPDSAIFDAAINSLKETLGGRGDELRVEDFEKVYVGDEMQNDYFGAQNAGWQALFLDRTNTLEKTFEEQGKRIITTTVRQPGWDGPSEIRAINGLEALEGWRPS